MKIYITAVVKLKPQYRSEMIQVLMDMVEETRKEEACIQYDLHVDLEDENILVFYEIWSNAEGLDRHNQQEYIKKISTMARKGYVTETIIYKTKKI